jgi:hypothetical protein
MTMESEENELEIALRRAYEEPAHRPEFYKTLLDSTVWVLGYVPGMKKGRTLLHAGKLLMIEPWQREDGKHVIPFFSSIPALQRSHESNHRGFTLKGRGLFQSMPHTHFVLNPNSRYYREFHPEEVASILSTGVPQAPELIQIQRDTAIHLEQPNEEPVKLIAALSLLLAKHSNVHAARLALMTVLDQPSSQSLIVGILGDDNMDKVSIEASSVIADTKPPGIPFDIAILKTGEKGLMDYFLTIKPFYERSWGAKLNSCIGSGRA